VKYCKNNNGKQDLQNMKEIAKRLIKPFPSPIRQLAANVYTVIINTNRSKVIMTALYHMYWYKITNRNFQGLHLGSGNASVPTFCNVDANISCKCDIVSDIKRLKLSSETVGAIYCSHIFEHFPQKEANYVLAEWHRVLKMDGTLFICVPDIERLFHIYLDNLSNYDTKEGRKVVDTSCGIVYGGQTNKYDYHFYGYSFTTLFLLLRSAGFRDIQLFDRSTDDIFPSRDASFAKIGENPISLNIKATK
jgi:predicted SAM-dependent methyltransferase